MRLPRRTTSRIREPERSLDPVGREPERGRRRPVELRRFLHAAGQQPPPGPPTVQPREISHPIRERLRIGDQALPVVEHVLQHVVMRIADVRLRIDQQPPVLAVMGEDIARVQVRDQQDLLPVPVPGQLAEQTEAMLDEVISSLQSLG